jgi:hypothetical protein
MSRPAQGVTGKFRQQLLLLLFRALDGTCLGEIVLLVPLLRRYRLLSGSTQASDNFVSERKMKYDM